MIHQYRVQNFKSIRDVTVEFSPVTVLLGKSGVGKSNLVESLQFLRDLLSITSTQASSGNLTKELKNKWTSQKPATSKSNLIKYWIEFSIDCAKEKFTYELSIAPGTDLKIQHERLVCGENCIFEQKSTGNNTFAWTEKPRLVEIPDPGFMALGRLPSIPESVIALTSLTTAIGVYTFSDTVLGPNSAQRGNESRIKSGAASDSSSGLNDQATNYLATLREIYSDLQNLNVRKTIVGTLQQVNPGVTSIELDDIRNPSHVVVGHQFEDKILSLQLAQESAGFRRFYAHLLALYQKPPKQTLIFEHPEDGIHPGALSVLAEEFKAAPANTRGQVILTTHNPALLDYFEWNQIRVVELKGFETQVGMLSSEQREALQESLLDPGELLTVDPARIDSGATEAAGA